MKKLVRAVGASSTRATVCAGFVLTLLSGIGGTGCDDSEVSPRLVPLDQHTTSTWGVRVYVQTPAGKQLVNSPPILPVPFNVENQVNSGEAPPTRDTMEEVESVVGAAVTGDEDGPGREPFAGSTPQSTIGVDGTSWDQDQTLADRSGWLLLTGAAVQCGLPALKGFMVPPWQPEYEYIFAGQTTNCERQLAREEILVCIADKLLEISDAVAPISWTGMTAANGALPSGFPAGDEWLIPVQGSKDKFIARDLAINVLSHIPYLDASVKPPTGSHSCGSQQAVLLNTTSIPSEAVQAFLFGTTGSLYGPQTGHTTGWVASDFRAYARSRIALRSHVLRTGARMLRDALEESVMADLSGAQWQRAHAGDLTRGNELFWSDARNPDAPYNSMGHVARILFGRWELGPFRPDPQCAGIAELDLIPRAYGPDLAGRRLDYTMTRVGQQLAVEMVSGYGLVFPQSVLDTVDDDTLRNAVLDQIVGREAKRQGVDPTDSQALNDFKQVGQGVNIINLFNQLETPDLRAALGKSFREYQLASSTPASIAALSSGRGGMITDPEFTASSVTALGGLALKSGVPTGDLVQDFMARAAGVQTASECAEAGTSITTLSQSRTQALHVNSLGNHLFQSGFASGQAYARRLASLRAHVSLHSYTATPDTQTWESLVDLTGKAAAEPRAWAGPGRFVADASARRGTNQISTLNLWVFGYEPSDWGATSPDEMPTQIGLLYGEPWEADCAAGLRDNCAKSIIGAGLRNPATVSVGASSDSLTSVFGFDGPMLTLSFNYSSELDLVPPTFAGSQLPSKHFYVILKRDPHQPQAKGKVLAAFDLRTPNRAVSTVDSALQRKLLNQTLGIPSNYPSTSTKLGATNLSLSESYCLGLPWNKFIPLENELTSNTQENSGYEDSWQHYLNLAEVAAAHADELGEKLIDLGIQKDMRREAAGEALANICGVHGALDKVSEDSQHKIAAAPDDGNLQECLGETKADVLFLGADPYKGMSEEVATDTIRSKVFLCDDPDPKKHHNLCDKKGPLTHAGLDLFASEEATSLTDCSAISKVVPSMESGMKTGAIQQAQSSSWASKTKLQAAVSSLSFTLNRDASWTLSYGGSVVMNSKFNNSRIWPGCTRAGAADCYLPGDDFDRNELLARHFERAFRSGAGTLGTHDNFLYQQPSNPDDLDTWKADAEAMAIGWRVQAALWTLGRMAGFIPEGLFNVPVPGVYLSDTNQTVHGMVPHPGKVPMLTLFNRSRYTFVEETDGVPLFQLKTGEQLKDQDINIVGKVKPIPGNYNFGSPNELPFWMHHIYGGPSITGHPKSYLMTKAKNKAIVVQHRFKDTLKEFFGNQAAAYQGIVCKDAGHVAFDGPEYTAPGVPPWSAHLEFIELKNSMPMTLDLNVLETALPATGTPWGKTKARDGGAPSAVEMVLVAGAGNASAYSVVRDLFGYYYTDSFIDPLARGYYQQKDAVPYLKEIYEDTLGPDGFTGAMGDLRWAERPGFGTEVDTDATNECNPAWVEGMHFIDPSPSSGVDCLEPFDVTANLQDIHHRPAWTMLPRAVPPSDRVQFFINAGPPQGVCGAAAQLAQALVLSCELSDPASIPPPSSPPNVKSIDDLFGLSLYLGVVESSVNASASGLYATSIPQRSVDAAKASEQVGGPLKGTHAEPVLQMSRSLRAIAQDWINIRTTLGAMRESSHAAYLQLKQVDLQTQQKAVELTLREIDVDSSTANQIAAAVTACSVPITVGKSFAVSATFNPIACGAAVVNAAVQINLNGERLSNLETLKELAGESQDVSALVIISDLNTKMREYYKVLTENFTNLYNEIASLQSASVQLAGLESEAQYQAAVGSGADYYVDEATNEPVAIPVNTVQRRLYDITANRYKDALKHAKYQAYFARLAIEQRLGVRLSTLQNAIGPLEPPAEWADDVCTLQGIDYQKLCESKLPGGKTSICGFQSGDGSGGNVSSLSEEELIENFADQYIGDYVRKLKDFVEYYNIQYPSHDGEDLAVLSFKDSLLASTGPCQSLSRNLLYYSSDLDSRDVVNEDGTQVVRGWQYTPCAVNGQCLQVVSGEGIEFSPNDDILDPGSPTQSANNAFVWLYDVAPATPPDSGNIAVSVLPRKAVHQKVSLTSGTNYILSWWDMAVSKNGGPWEPGPDQAVPEQAYLIGVYDANGVAQATRMEPASYKVVDGKQVWSDRLNLQFQVDQSGDYEVVVAASSTLDTNSLLIGGIQLENGASLTPYSDVTSTRLTPSLICEAERTAEDVQGAFEHKCAGNICWYELEAPIVLDTSIAGTTQSPLFGILAAGNFNYRDISIALNLVGTGILNCSQNGTSTCYSSSYVEYTLEHDAFDVGVTSWHKQGGDFEEQDFNFGLATIEHGKGLTAERVITSPIASSDAELIQQLSVEKGEFRGRPLDGVYRLKIWDKPELRWNKLQDIQFVVKYRYWSKIRAGL